MGAGVGSQIGGWDGGVYEIASGRDGCEGGGEGKGRGGVIILLKWKGEGGSILSRHWILAMHCGS